MIEKLLNYLEKHTRLSEQEKEMVRSLFPVQTFEKGSLLLKEGEISRAFYFNLSGCVRLYYTVDGEEKTAFFYSEDQFISSYESFTGQAPAKHSLQCIEDCSLVIISAEHAHQLLNFSPKFDFLARVIMEEELSLYQKILATFITLNPEQRYLNFMENYPELLQRIPQHYLATYLGVKPESLSRIRKRILDRHFLN